MRFSVVDQRGRELAAGRDLAALQSRLAERARTDVAVATAAVTPGRELERTGLTTWDFDALPEQVTATQGGSTVVGYPALVDEGTSVGGAGVRDARGADAAHPRGVRRLVALALPNPLGYVQEQLTGPEKLVLATAPLPVDEGAARRCAAGGRRRPRRHRGTPRPRRIRRRARDRVAPG